MYAQLRDKNNELEQWKQRSSGFETRLSEIVILQRRIEDYERVLADNK